MEKIIKKLVLLLLSIAVSACQGPDQRNKWQKQKEKKKEFKERRIPYYNDFVESGGMIDDINNPGKKSIQEAFKEGKQLSIIEGQELEEETKLRKKKQDSFF